MSKALTNLRKMETRTFREWTATVRYLTLCRNAMTLADAGEVAEKKTLYTMAIASADRAYRTWSQVCDALDELEEERTDRHGNGEARRRQPQTPSANPPAGNSGKDS